MNIFLKVLGWFFTVFGIVGGIPSLFRSIDDGARVCVLLIYIAVFIALGWFCFYKASQRDGKKSQMKIAVIVSVAMIVLSLVSQLIRKSNHGEIRSQIEQVNQKCPIPLSGGPISITHMEIDGDYVVFNFDYKQAHFDRELLENQPDAARDLFLVSFLATGTSGESMIRQITDDGLGIKVNVDDGKGEVFTCDMPIDYIKEKMSQIKANPFAALNNALQLQIKTDSRALPMDLGQGLEITGFRLQGHNILTETKVDENQYDISRIKNFIPMIKQTMLQEIIQSNDASTKLLVKYCKLVHCGIIFRFVGSLSGDSIDVPFDYNDISDYNKTKDILYQ